PAGRAMVVDARVRALDPHLERGRAGTVISLVKVAGLPGEMHEGVVAGMVKLGQIAAQAAAAAQLADRRRAVHRRRKRKPLFRLVIVEPRHGASAALAYRKRGGARPYLCVQRLTFRRARGP